MIASDKDKSDSDNSKSLIIEGDTHSLESDAWYEKALHSGKNLITAISSFDDKNAKLYYYLKGLQIPAISSLGIILAIIISLKVRRSLDIGLMHDLDIVAAIVSTTFLVCSIMLTVLSVKTERKKVKYSRALVEFTDDIEDIAGQQRLTNTINSDSYINFNELKFAIQSENKAAIKNRNLTYLMCSLEIAGSLFYVVAAVLDLADTHGGTSFNSSYIFPNVRLTPLLESLGSAIFIVSALLVVGMVLSANADKKKIEKGYSKALKAPEKQEKPEIEIPVRSSGAAPMTLISVLAVSVACLGIGKFFHSYEMPGSDFELFGYKAAVGLGIRIVGVLLLVTFFVVSAKMFTNNQIDSTKKTPVDYDSKVNNLEDRLTELIKSAAEIEIPTNSKNVAGSLLIEVMGEKALNSIKLGSRGSSAA